MAGDWIPMRTDLRGDPAVMRMATALALPRAHVVGLLLVFWSWASTASATGRIEGATEELIDEEVGVRGFASAACAAGWLVLRDGGVTIPHFDRWLSRGAKNRLMTARRQQKKRHGESHGSVTKMSRSQRDKSVTTVQYSTEQKKRQEEPPLPPALAGGAFVSSWGKYVEYRKSKRLRPLLPASVAAKWAEMATWGEAAACESIARTIANGWSGLFEPQSARLGSAPVRESQDAQAARMAREIRAGLRTPHDPPEKVFDLNPPGGTPSP